MMQDKPITRPWGYLKLTKIPFAEIHYSTKIQSRNNPLI